MSVYGHDGRTRERQIGSACACVREPDDRWGIILFYVQWATARRMAHRRRRKKWQRARAARYWPISKVISARVPPPRLGAVVVGGVACTAATAQRPIPSPSGPSTTRARPKRPTQRHNNNIIRSTHTHTHTNKHTHGCGGCFFFRRLQRSTTSYTRKARRPRGHRFRYIFIYFFYFSRVEIMRKSSSSSSRRPRQRYASIVDKCI